MVSSPIYFLHIVSNINNPREQKTFSMCITDAVKYSSGHFERGTWIHDPIEDDTIFYHRDELDEGYAPPAIIVDIIKYLVDNNLWMGWMKQFDRILLIRKFIEG